VWLDPNRTSAYKFYQYWLNASDEDAANFIKIFTQRTKEEIEALVAEHEVSPGERKLQRELAKDITIRVHSVEAFETALKASSLLFGSSTTEDLVSLDEATLLSVLEGVPQAVITKSAYEQCGSAIELLSETTQNIIFPSKGEARKMIQAGGVSINKSKITDGNAKPALALLHNKFLLAQKGKKNYFLIEVKD